MFQTAILSFFFIGSLFSAQPEFCASRCLQIKDIHFVAKWADGWWAPNKPDPQIDLFWNYVKFGATPTCSGQNSCTWAGPYSVCGISDTAGILTFAIYDEEDHTKWEWRANYSDYNFSPHPVSLKTSIKWTTLGDYTYEQYELRFAYAVVCTLTACASRYPITTGCYSSLDTTPCYQQLNPSNSETYLTLCNTTCPTGISDTNDEGKCRLIPNCYDRQPNTAYSFPCGTSNCYQQLDYAGDLTLHTTCNDSCPSSLSDGNDTTGTCVLKDCALRVIDSSHAYPCGTSDCFQQLDYAGDGTLHTTCNVGCPSSLSDGNDTTGTCVLKDCALRVVDLAHAYPCGTSDCFQQSKDGTKTDKCGTQQPQQPQSPNSKSKTKQRPTIIIVAVVVSVTVVLAAVVIIVLVVVKFRRSKNSERGEELYNVGGGTSGEQ